MDDSGDDSAGAPSFTLKYLLYIQDEAYWFQRFLLYFTTTVNMQNSCSFSITANLKFV